MSKGDNNIPKNKFLSVKPLVSAIVVNWNGIKYVEKCLNSLLEQEGVNFEVIVIDNGSTDGSYEYLKAQYNNQIILLRNSKNLGFAVGNNQGIRIAKGSYIALLNNDAWATKGWIRTLVNAAEGDKKIGMCSSKIYLINPQEERIIDNIGHLFYPDGLNRGKGRLEKDDGQYDDNPEAVLFPSGAACLYRMEMLKEIGLFDESFFSYGDDSDIGLRGRWAGWRCVYVPEAVVYHLHSASTDAYSPLKVFYTERNRVWLAIKYLPISMLLVSPYYTFLRYFAHFYGVIIGQGASGEFVKKQSIWRWLMVFIKAYLSAIKGFPMVYRQRREMSRLKRLTSTQMKALLHKYRIPVKEINREIILKK